MRAKCAANRRDGCHVRHVVAFSEYGLNVLPEKKKSKILMFLSYLWGPMPIAIWIAVIIEIIRAAIAKEDYEGFAVLLVLQFANAIIGFIEESNAGDAIAALKSQLAPQCHVCREGKWLSMPAKNLVPGDLIELKLGDVVPADAILLEGQPVQVRQCQRGVSCSLGPFRPVPCRLTNLP